MVYLKGFSLPGVYAEEGFLNDIKRTCYTDFYPFGIFPAKELEHMTFEPITFFYGGNGSGKTTLINVIAECIGARRSASYNKSSFFGDFTERCNPDWASFYQDSTVITSDDVFDYIFDLRALNEGVDVKREALLEEYTKLKSTRFQFRSLSDYEQLKKVNDSRRHSGSEFVRRNLMQNVPERSNGESALLYFTNKIEANQIYLLDEPENSLSAAYQQELLRFIEDSARFYHCQFIIATHSPFLLAANYAKIYDLDAVPVCARRWTELENVRRYYDFFTAHREEFENEKK